MNEPDVSRLVIEGLMELISGKKEQGNHGLPALNESTYLIGQRSVIDSLGLVTLIIDMEQRLADDYGIFITIADERAMSLEKSPFRTVRTLSNYINLLVEERKQNVPA